MERTSASSATLHSAAPCPDAAIAQLHAARLRKALSADGIKSVYVHAARPAPSPRLCPLIFFGSSIAPVSVFRDVLDDFACVLAAGAIHSIYLGPSALRDLAARLIDAAHDIEAHPASGIAAAKAVA